MHISDATVMPVSVYEANIDLIDSNIEKMRKMTSSVIEKMMPG